MSKKKLKLLPILCTQFALWGAFACGSTAHVARPDTPTAAQVLNETCIQEKDSPSPLVVDMNPDTRADIEIAMRKGLAVVHYDCKSLRVLPHCILGGDYIYTPVTQKRHTVKLETAAELKANLPLATKYLSMSLNAELRRGSSIDVELDIVGKEQSLAQGVAASDLDGVCEGATHVVRGATIGAFVIKSKSHADAKTTAEVFGTEGKNQGEERHEIFQSDGNSQACFSKQDSLSAPTECSALLKVDLLAIQPQASIRESRAYISQVSTDRTSCSSGLRWDGVKCSTTNNNNVYSCQPDNVLECKEQCDKGHPGSCNSLGFLYFDGRGVQLDRQKAAELFNIACRGGDMHGCNNLGTAYYKGLGMIQSNEFALESYKEACHATPELCYNLGVFMRDDGRGYPSKARAAELFSRSCLGGNISGCSELANAYSSGAGVNKDLVKAKELYNKACSGNHPSSCRAIGARYMNGNGSNIDYGKSFQYLNRSCELADMTGCGLLGLLYYEGKGVKTAPTKGMNLMKHSCNSGSAEGCVFLGVLEKNKGNEELASYYLKKACENGMEEECTTHD